MNPEETQQQPVYQVLIVGDEGVGKTSLITKCTGNPIPEEYIPSMEVGFEICNIDVNGRNTKFHLWDISGKDKLNPLALSYQDIDFIILIYDITNKNSLSSIDTWIDHIEKFGKGDVPKLLVGNKADQEHRREVSFEEAKAYADQLSLHFLEASTRDLVNLDYIFSVLVNQLEDPERTASPNKHIKKKHNNAETAEKIKIQE